jgi:hypothetical protein
MQRHIPQGKNPPILNHIRQAKLIQQHINDVDLNLPLYIIAKALHDDDHHDPHM